MLIRLSFSVSFRRISSSSRSIATSFASSSFLMATTAALSARPHVHASKNWLRRVGACEYARGWYSVRINLKGHAAAACAMD